VKKEYTIIAEPTGRKIDDAEKPADMNKWNLHEGKQYHVAAPQQHLAAAPQTLL
jgi:hypothetical protein